MSAVLLIFITVRASSNNHCFGHDERKIIRKGFREDFVKKNGYSSAAILR